MPEIKIDRNLIDSNDYYEFDLSDFTDDDIISEYERRQHKPRFEDDLKDALMIEECEECEECEGCDLSDFDNDDLIMELESRGVDIKVSQAETIRDEQYEEIFEQLKEKYSVQELQRLLA